MKKTLIIILLAIAGSYGIASAQTPKVIMNDKTGWHKIGETTVNFKTEKDVITVLGADRFASIKFKVTDAAIHLVSLEIFFENGDTQPVTINSAINANGESRVIDLINGSERSIKKIEFMYKTVPNSRDEKAHVEIWGLKTNTVK
ncbi:MAG: hypothetical protein ABI723_25265 [Bacteroidia bacterium]